MSKSLVYYYDLMSQPSRALYIILKLSGTPFVSKLVALRKGEHLTEEFKNNINRFQRVPCINDDGFKLSESVAILKYIHAKGQISPDLYPVDLRERARVDEFLSWHHLTLRAGCAQYFRAVWLEPLISGQKPNLAKIGKLRNFMENNLELMEHIWLKSSQYLTSDKMTAADIFAACEVEQIGLADYDISCRYPKITEWVKRVRSKANPHYDDAHKILKKLSTSVESKL